MGTPTAPDKKPVSARQLAANRRNAKKSTGPTSEAGKERSSRNRVDHGMYADLRPIEDGRFREDPLALQAMVDAVLEVLKPRNGMERSCALRIANLEIQIGRFRAFEAVSLLAGTSDAKHNLIGPGVFDAQYNAELFGDLAMILRRDPSTYTPLEWRDLLLGAATFDEDLADLYQLLDLDDPAALESVHDTILLSTEYHQGGSLAEASRRYEQFASSEANRLPDAATELERASLGVSYMLKNGTLDSHTKIYARLSAALDRELNRYERLREITDQQADLDQDWEAEHTGDEAA